MLSIETLIIFYFIGITQLFIIPSIVKDILEEKNKLPDSNVFSVSIQVLVEKRQEAISSDAGPIERFLLATILTFITLPLIFLTLIIAPIAWVVSLSIEYFFPPTEEEKKLKANTEANKKTTTLGEMKLISDDLKGMEEKVVKPKPPQQGQKMVRFEGIENPEGKGPAG